MDLLQVKEWLRDNGFKVYYAEVFYPDFIFFNKNQMNIIVKEYSLENLAKNVRSDAVDIRHLLSDINKNIWNTYLFICSDNKDKDITYEIERDSVGIRKYVINSEKDLKRIPYLDTTSSTFNKTDNLISLPEISTNCKLETLINEIIIYEGFHRKLNNSEVDKIVLKFLDSE